MEIKNTFFDDAKIFIPKVYEDERGYFTECFNEVINKEINLPFLQDNHSKSKKGVIRGLHYQWDKPMGKLLRVITGSIFDVIVDIRPNSSTFGKWQGFELSEDNKHILWAPPGFAHGFLSLEDNTHVCYKTTSLYNSSCDGAINPTNSGLDIEWPLDASEIILSEKDALAQTFKEYSLNPKF